MRRLAALLCLIFLAPQLAQAKSLAARQQQDASVVFWNFATCIAERNPDAVRKLLARRYWQAGDVSLASSLAQRGVDEYPQREEPCGLFEELKFNSELFRGALAGAMFLRDTHAGELPDYSAIEPPVTASDFASASDDATRLELGLRAFAFCVFHNRPSDVRALLVTRPFTEVETKLFDSLATTFGGCLPAKEGTRISFSPVKLRSLLGEAAYYANSSLSGRPSTGTTH